jgi:hypothetical protein
MQDRFPEFANWRKSERSGTGEGCVEVAITEDQLGVRDTKNRLGGALVFPLSAWGSLMASVKA